MDSAAGDKKDAHVAGLWRAIDVLGQVAIAISIASFLLVSLATAVMLFVASTVTVAIASVVRRRRE